MKPAQFEYFDPGTLDEALGLLREHGDDAKVLAGGQSLVPIMNFRLARPKVIVDVNKVPGLDYIREADGMIHIGALTRQRSVETSALVKAKCPLLYDATYWVGHLAIRTRGTVGGTIAHADPAAEYPCVLTALGGEVVIKGQGGEKVVKPEDFFVTFLTTSLQPTEMVTEVRFPKIPPEAGCTSWSSAGGMETSPSWAWPPWCNWTSKASAPTPASPSAAWAAPPSRPGRPRTC